MFGSGIVLLNLGPVAGETLSCTLQGPDPVAKHQHLAYIQKLEVTDFLKN